MTSDFVSYVKSAREAAGEGSTGVGCHRHPESGVTFGRCDLCRFLKYVQITPTCWLWTGTFYTQFGQPTYGQFYLSGQRMGAHRASYILHVGPIPDGLDILHSCDVKACVNPADLHPGTHQENLAEAVERHGEWRHILGGEGHPQARLDWPKVHAIRAAWASGATQDALARQYAVTQAHISYIVNGRRWIERPEEATA